jgi:hypothetical protein
MVHVKEALVVFDNKALSTSSAKKLIRVLWFTPTGFGIASMKGYVAMSVVCAPAKLFTENIEATIENNEKQCKNC